MHCSHCGKPDYNVAKCAAKKAGEPTVKKRKRPTVEQADKEARHEEEYLQVCATTLSSSLFGKKCLFDYNMCFKKSIIIRLKQKHCCPKWTTLWCLNYWMRYHYSLLTIMYVFGPHNLT
jgi:hypothetical protein